ncbi:MAG: hypothetical protein ACK5Z5_09130 [Neisseriaceae bacterium]
MRSFTTFLVTVICLILTACGGSGGSSTPGSTTVSNNFIQITPESGVTITNNIVENSYYTTFELNGLELYAGTSNGIVLKINPRYDGWVTVESTTNSQPIITIAGDNSSGVYYVPYPSNVAYTTSAESGFTNDLDSGDITAITSASNGSIYFGTSDGNVGLTNNPAGKIVRTIPTPSFGPILGIFCTNNSCNSGQQGLLVFQAESALIPAFESSVYSNDPSQYDYKTRMYYLDLESWIPVVYDHVISHKTVTIESITYNNVPEFVTTITVDKGIIYAGTNFFNIYSASLKCNHGQGCSIAWNSSPINTIPLDKVTNGSQGISSLKVLDNGQLYVVSSHSESTINVYKSKNTH